MQNNDDVEPWHSRVPPGVPGAGWLIGFLFVFTLVVFGEWWLQSGHGAVAAPAASVHTSK
jgi:hypothetical protein